MANAKRAGQRVTRDAAIHLRATRRQREIIDRAAQALGKTRSDFMLEAACRAADDVFLDQRIFELDERTYRRFIDALDRAPGDDARLRRLLATAPPWGR